MVSLECRLFLDLSKNFGVSLEVYFFVELRSEVLSLVDYPFEVNVLVLWTRQHLSDSCPERRLLFVFLQLQFLRVELHVKVLELLLVLSRSEDTATLLAHGL